MRVVHDGRGDGGVEGLPLGRHCVVELEDIIRERGAACVVGSGPGDMQQSGGGVGRPYEGGRRRGGADDSEVGGRVGSGEFSLSRFVGCCDARKDGCGLQQGERSLPEQAHLEIAHLGGEQCSVSRGAVGCEVVREGSPIEEEHIVARDSGAAIVSGRIECDTEGGGSCVGSESNVLRGIWRLHGLELEQRGRVGSPPVYVPRSHLHVVECACVDAVSYDCLCCLRWSG